MKRQRVLARRSLALALLAHVATAQAQADAEHATGVGVAQASAHEASADEPVDEAASSSEVDALIEQAVAELEASNQEQALLVLQQAALLQPTSPRVRVHLAAVHQAMGELLTAEQHLSFALAQRDDPYVAAHEEALLEALSSIEAQLGRLLVSGQPAGADVFLDGRRIGKLPLEAPARILAGPHVLRISRSGYRAFTASFDAAAGVSVNQVVYLEPEPRRVAPRLVRAADGTRDSERSASSRWLTWSFAGLSGAAAVTSAAAFLMREQHAARWNSVSCLEPGRTRAEVCAGERARAEDWERVMIGSGITAGALLGGALISWSLDSGKTERSSALESCGLSPSQLYCRGRF